MSIMPSSAPVSITVCISCVRFSRIRLATAAFEIISSYAGMSPPEMRGISRWENTPAKEPESWMRICSCWPGGNESIMRSIVCDALLVCRVENTRCPVSAAVTAVDIVCGVRISPIIITSTSCLNTDCSATIKSAVSTLTSRWSMRDFLFSNKYSIGSSMVIMCSVRS